MNISDSTMKKTFEIWEILTQKAGRSFTVTTEFPSFFGIILKIVSTNSEEKWEWLSRNLPFSFQ